MSKSIKTRSILLSMVLLGLMTSLFSQGAEIKPVRLAENLYLISGLGGNIVFLVTGEGVLVVDSGSMSIHGRQVTEAIARISSKPVRYLVITHYHYDHSGGAGGFGPEVTIVGQEKLERNLIKNSGPLINKLAIPQFKVYLDALEAKVKNFESESNTQLDTARQQLEFVQSMYRELKHFSPPRPDITFNRKRVIQLGGESIELIHKGSGHTDDACLVYFPRQKVLHTGDLFGGRGIDAHPPGPMGRGTQDFGVDHARQADVTGELRRAGDLLPCVAPQIGFAADRVFGNGL